MGKTLGSQTFGTTEMKTDEVVLFATVAKNNGHDNETILSDIELIDDLLGIQKMNAIIIGQQFTKTGRLRKNATLQEMISKRIGFK